MARTSKKTAKGKNIKTFGQETPPIMDTFNFAAGRPEDKFYARPIHMGELIKMHKGADKEQPITMQGFLNGDNLALSDEGLVDFMINALNERRLREESYDLADMMRLFGTEDPDGVGQSFQNYLLQELNPWYEPEDEPEDEPAEALETVKNK